MKSALKLERRTTSPSISAREATANTGGPLRRSVRASRSCGGSAARAAANARRTSAQAASSASVSAPGARVCSTRSACAPSRELHTPSLERGVRSVPMASRIVSSSPVGSCANRGFSNGPSEEASAWREPTMASCSPGTAKCAGVTASLRR